MRHCGTLKLETDRLILRRYSVNDASAMFGNWSAEANDTNYKCLKIFDFIISYVYY